jgi:hypothetical protein
MILDVYPWGDDSIGEIDEVVLDVDAWGDDLVGGIDERLTE